MVLCMLQDVCVYILVHECISGVFMGMFVANPLGEEGWGKHGNRSGRDTQRVWSVCYLISFFVLFINS